MSTLDVTLTTIVHNEAEYIEPMLIQLRPIVKDIIVFNCSSTDSTEAIARKYTDNIHLKPVTGSSDIGGFKQEIIDMVKTEWLLMMDGDELLSEELLNRVQSGELLNTNIRGWWFRRRWIVDGKDTAILWPDYQHRLLYHTAKWHSGIHTSPSSEPSAKCDTGHIVHRVSSKRLQQRWEVYSKLSPASSAFNSKIIQEVKNISVEHTS